MQLVFFRMHMLSLNIFPQSYIECLLTCIGGYEMFDIFLAYIYVCVFYACML